MRMSLPAPVTGSIPTVCATGADELVLLETCLGGCLEALRLGGKTERVPCVPVGDVGVDHDSCTKQGIGDKESSRVFGKADEKGVTSQ